MHNGLIESRFLSSTHDTSLRGRLKRICRLVASLPPTRLYDDWLVMVILHVQNALRRLRDLMAETILGSLGPRNDSRTRHECCFCAGELQGVVTEIEDLFEVLDVLNRERGPLVSSCMNADAKFMLSKMLQSRKMQYMKNTRRRASEPSTISASPPVAGKGLSSSATPSTLRPDGVERRRATSVDVGGTAAPLVGLGAALGSPTAEKFEWCRSCYRSAVAKGGSPREVQSRFPWKLQWLQSPWMDLSLAAQPRVKTAAAALVKKEAQQARDLGEYLGTCYEQQINEDKTWKLLDSRSPMYPEGRTIKSQLEEAEHQRQASRTASTELQQRLAIAKWATVMRTLSAEWSSWAVDVSQSVALGLRGTLLTLLSLGRMSEAGGRSPRTRTCSVGGCSCRARTSSTITWMRLTRQGRRAGWGTRGADRHPRRERELWVGTCWPEPQAASSRCRTPRRAAPRAKVGRCRISQRAARLLSR
jgi:hypothetical protein